MHLKIIAEELAHPAVLWDRGEALVEEELKGVVVDANDESALPEIRLLVPYDLHQPYELALICR
jgi:hypothetical protein